MKNYDLVTQEDLMGCGLACVASRIGKTYQETKNQATHPEHTNDRGYYCKNLVDELKKEGLEYRFRKVKKLDDRILQKDGVIVFIQRGEIYQNGHWLLKTSKGWMNPWINFEEWDVQKAKSGYQERLPDKPEWVVYPLD